MNHPKITFHVLTFNKLSYLKNLIKSFVFFNKIVNYEFIIADYGSTDGTREYLNNLKKKHKKFIIFLGDRSSYFKQLECRGLDLSKNHIQKYVMIHKYRLDVLKIASGDYYFDLGERHQFIRELVSLNDLIKDYNYIEEKFDFKIGGFNVRSPSLFGVFKKNNTYSHKIKTEYNTYYVCDKKGYDDFYFWNSDVYKKFGEFNYHYLNNKNKFKENDQISHMHDYSKKLIRNNYRKVFLKIPLTVEFPINLFTEFYLNYKKNDLFFKIRDNFSFLEKFENYNRPITSNDLFYEYGLSNIPKHKVLTNLIFKNNHYYYYFKNYEKLHN
jgi:hypothetical protein